MTYLCTHVGPLLFVDTQCFAIKKVFFIGQQNIKESARLQIGQRLASSLFEYFGAVVENQKVDDDKSL
jgi:hypothetical protein